MARLQFVKSARKARPQEKIKVGDSFYWAAFRVGRSSFKRYWKTKPPRSALTQSAYYGSIYDLEDSMDWSATEAGDLDTKRNDFVAEIENIKEECQSSLDNMPEHLQESSVLNERIEALENTISEYEQIDLEYEEPDADEIRKEITEKNDDPKVIDAMIEEKKAEHLDEWIQEKVGELEGVDFRYE